MAFIQHPHLSVPVNNIWMISVAKEIGLDDIPETQLLNVVAVDSSNEPKAFV